jgi:alpha-D-ribose 1-methylphosphonate 5-triphosphate synthase subunit PhnH
VLLAGFANPVLDAQRTFRAALDAMAHPGRVVRVDGPVDTPPPLGAAAAALCLTLLDLDTPLWVDPAASAPEVLEYLRFHCGCPLASSATAAFALVADAGRLGPDEVFSIGTDEEPEGGATLIVQVEALTAGHGRRLTGPGIAGEARLTVRGLPEDVWRRLGTASGRFPRGLDAFLVSRTEIAAVPRTTRIEG